MLVTLAVCRCLHVCSSPPLKLETLNFKLHNSVVKVSSSRYHFLGDDTHAASICKSGSLLVIGTSCTTCNTQVVHSPEILPANPCQRASAKPFPLSSFGIPGFWCEALDSIHLAGKLMDCEDPTLKTNTLGGRLSPLMVHGSTLVGINKEQAGPSWTSWLLVFTYDYLWPEHHCALWSWQPSWQPPHVLPASRWRPRCLCCSLSLLLHICGIEATLHCPPWNWSPCPVSVCQAWYSSKTLHQVESKSLSVHRFSFPLSIFSHFPLWCFARPWSQDF